VCVPVVPAGSELQVVASSTHFNVPLTLSSGTLTLLGTGSLNIGTLTMHGNIPVVKATQGASLGVDHFVILITSASAGSPTLNTLSVSVNKAFNWFALHLVCFVDELNVPFA
jgi:hypothetical protein